jgi:hypothetical protein
LAQAQIDSKVFIFLGSYSLEKCTHVDPHCTAATPPTRRKSAMDDN